jgi:cyclin B
VAEFTKDILKHYMSNQSKNQPRSNYMHHQPHINDKMRSILIDWLIEIRQQFRGLKNESLFLTVNLIDRFLEKQVVSTENLQLVGVTAMLISCKYEEIWPPLIKDYIFMCDYAYKREQIVEMEMQMLTTLDFNIDFISSHTILERFAKSTRSPTTWPST